MSLVARFLPSSAAVEELRKEIAASMPESTRTSLSIDLPLSPPAMRALGFAAEEAKVADDDYIVPAHLLLGVLHVKGSLAQTWLARKGLTLDSVRAHLQAPSGAGDPLANYKAVVALRDTFYPLLSRLGPEIEPALVLAWGPATKISETI
jgi:ATP-dependent Clp protease ATP-binding subunit ClpA